MKRHIRYAVFSLLAASAVFSTGHAAAPAPVEATPLSQCPAAVPFPNGVQVVKAVRVYTAANGESAFETKTYTGEGKAYFKPGEIFTHNDLGPAAKVQLISGPGNVLLKPHTGPRELFLIIQGSSTIVLPSGQEYAVTPGTLVFFDDPTSKTGHGGRTGPCGYIAINIVPAEPAAKP